MNTQKFNTLLADTAKSLLVPLPKRTRDILEKRFGLIKKQARTLEAIGQEYGITRERVRQIEERALRDLRQQITSTPKLASVFEKLNEHFDRHGKVRREDSLFQDFASSDQGVLTFLLTVHPAFYYVPENDFFHARWHTDEKFYKQAEKIVSAVVNNLGKEGRVLGENDFTKFIRDVAATLNSNHEVAALLSYVNTSKSIQKNVFGEYGLVTWSEIRPRGLRDKAYIVLKKITKPLHFREVAKAIAESGLNRRSVHPQTVHNELIRDNRFVLVGRGLYALADWGYAPGTVRDVIKAVLAEHGPLVKEEVLKKVLERRFVKENTVLLNLQNKSHFRRLEDGTYHLKEA